MGVLRRMFSGALRRARAAEAGGDYRKAAALYVEAEAMEQAADALVHAAERVTDLDARLACLQDALRWLPAGHARRAEIEGRIGAAILEDACARGASSAEEKRRLASAAERLEAAGRPGDAAVAWEMLGRRDDLARALTAAGEIEKLEKLLSEQSVEQSAERALRRMIGDYELAMASGARLEALDALRKALELAPGDAALPDLIRKIESRWAPAGRVTLEIDGRVVGVVGRLPAVLGRAEADVALRGASVSRRHCEIARDGARLVVRDLGSRNGTLVRGVPLAGALELGGDDEIGLGDDVAVQLAPEGRSSVMITVMRGLDAGARFVVGDGAMRVPGVPASIAFPSGRATLTADSGSALSLDEKRCSTPVTLLVGDVIAIGATRIEVRG